MKSLDHHSLFHVVGVDLGGTKIEACLMDQNRNCIRRERIPTEAAEGRERIILNILRLIEKVAQDHSVSAVGMGTPGTYRKAEDRLYGSPHTPVFEEPEFLPDLRSRIRVPLIVENDANCLALGEYRSWMMDRFKCVMAVILGTGLGTGLILEGRLYRGPCGNAGEWGHTTVQFEGRACQCGRRGCAEAYLSGPSMERRYQEISGERISLQTIYEYYLHGQPKAVSLMQESCRIMADFVANAINVLDLEAVVLGGGVSNLPIWYECVPDLVNSALFGLPRKVNLFKAHLGDSAGVLGAAFLALDLMNEP